MDTGTQDSQNIYPFRDTNFSYYKKLLLVIFILLIYYYAYQVTNKFFFKNQKRENDTQKKCKVQHEQPTNN